MHFTFRDWTRMSIAPTAAKVEHAKSQLKTSSLLILYGTMDIAEDIGRQLMTSSQRMTPRLIEKCLFSAGDDARDLSSVASKWGLSE